MPRTEEENRRVREEQGERILEAAMRVFARKGLAGTKMADIAAQARVSYGLAYHYFGSKERIFSLLVERAMQGSMQVARSARAMPGTPWDRLRWLVAQELDGMRDQSAFVMIVVQAMTTEAVPQELKQFVHSEGNAFNELLRELIVEGQAAGQVVQDDPEQLVAAVQGCISGLAVGATFREYDRFLYSLPDVEVVMRLLKP